MLLCVENVFRYLSFFFLFFPTTKVFKFIFPGPQVLLFVDKRLNQMIFNVLIAQ